VQWDRLRLHSIRARVLHWLVDEFVHAPLEPILHPSRSRLVWGGFFTLSGHLLFGLIWTFVLPQPYENLWVRCLLASLALLYVLPFFTREPSSTKSGRIFSAATWVQLPWFFSWMYFMNCGNHVWLASACAMVLIYFHSTDWRLASVGLLSGACMGYLGWLLVGQSSCGSALGAENLVVLAFAFTMGLMLGFSSANLRRTRLRNTLSTIGVMAHELRTPLATVNMMGDVLRNLGNQDMPTQHAAKLEVFAGRLQSLVRSMNRHIDTQITNAQLLSLPRHTSVIMAFDLVRDVVSQYPFRSTRERDSLRLALEADFCFLGSHALFSQVLVNLIKNALHSLAAASTAPQPGDLEVSVNVYGRFGRITVTDKGMGIPPGKQHLIFEPFYSMQRGVGNGLGLTFCKNVVESADGHLSVHSRINEGATFTIEVPLHTLAEGETPHATSTAP
jgi:two-component system, CAI-1 autoinducer sensor kinase/phosphatase CqsS